MQQTQLLFDLESTGLLRRGSRIHCIVARSETDGNTFIFDHQPDRSLDAGVAMLEQADVLIGHNIIGYDVPVFRIGKVSIIFFLEIHSIITAHG